MDSVELFSGCGGLALGLSKAGFKHRVMIEWDDDSVATITHNKSRKIDFVKEWPLQKADARLVNWKEFRGTQLVAGGPPCQPFSIGGKHLGHEDTRDMWPEAIRAVREIAPEAFLFENVRGLTRISFQTYLSWILEHLARPNIVRATKESLAQHLKRLQHCVAEPEYRVRVFQVNAADFGAAQKRHRILIMGVKASHPICIPTPTMTHSRARLLWDQWVEGSYWRRHGLKQPPDSQIQKIDLGIVTSLRNRMLSPQGEAWLTVRDALIGLGEPDGKANHIYQTGARRYAGHTGSVLDQPAKALKAGDHGVPGGENMMIRDDGSVRYFTIREAARLQGFPDSYEFPRSWTESMRQLGNAVPVPMAQHFASTLLQSLNVKKTTAA